MVQGGQLKKGKKANPNSAKMKQKHLKMTSKTKKGNPLQLPKNKYLSSALDDRAISREIGKSAEQKTAAKFIQGGGKLGTLKDVMQKGKELSKEMRRNQVKKKLTRVEEKLQSLKEKAEREGLD